MRISDWSSDVCSSDLVLAKQRRRIVVLNRIVFIADGVGNQFNSSGQGMLHFQLHLAVLNLWMLESLIHAVNWPAWHTDGFQYFAPIFGAFSLHQFGQQGHELFAVENARRARDRKSTRL